MPYSWRSPQPVSTHAIGIDIADGSLELVNCVENRDGLLSVREHARVLLSRTTIVHGLINEPELLKEALMGVITKAHLSPDDLNVITALPDSQVLTKIIPVSGLPDHPSFEYLEKLIPEIFKDLGYKVKKPVIQWRFSSVAPRRGLITLFVTSAPYIHQWYRFFKEQGMRLVGVEMESLAVARALIQRCDEGEHIGIIDFGFRQTNVSVTTKSGIAYSHAIDRGGLQLTELLAGETRITMSEAERMKKSIGLSQDKNVAVAHFTDNYMRELLVDVTRSFKLYDHPVTRSIITGGGAMMSGIRKLTGDILKHPVSRGSLWVLSGKQKNIQIPSSTMTMHEQQYYAGATGLAIRGTTQKSLFKGINFIS